jgi:hypothetical protein
MFSFSAILVCSATLTPSAAADYAQISLKKGDVAEYKVGSWVVRTPVNTLRVVFQDIIGTIVTTNSTYSGPSGKILSNLETYNIRSPLSSDHNSSDLSFLFPHPLLIAANLGSGDPIYIGAEVRISETITMNIGNTDRLVNHANFSSSSGFYWDKQTGLLVKLFSSIVNLDLTYTTAMYRRPSDVIPVLLAAGGIVVLTAIIVIVDTSGKKHE